MKTSFNVTVLDPPENHRYTHFLFDLVRMIAFGLEELGHDCTLTRNRTEPGRTNILVGIHLLTQPDFVESLVDSGHRYVVYQTEIIQPGAINGTALENRFQRILNPLLERAAAVWDTSDDNLAALRKMGVDAQLLNFGYCQGLQEIRHHAERDIDFLFYGSLTTRRREVLGTLEQLGYRVKVMFDDASLFRNDLIARSEVVLTLRQSEAQAHLPQARLLYLVNNGALVSGDSGLGQEPLEDLFLWTREPKDVVELLRQTRARPDRRELAATFHQRFQQRPMARFLEPLVKTLESR